MFEPPDIPMCSKNAVPHAARGSGATWMSTQTLSATTGFHLIAIAARAGRSRRPSCCRTEVVPDPRLSSGLSALVPFKPGDVIKIVGGQMYFGRHRSVFKRKLLMGKQRDGPPVLSNVGRHVATAKGARFPRRSLDQTPHGPPPITHGKPDSFRPFFEDLGRAAIRG